MPTSICGEWWAFVGSQSADEVAEIPPTMPTLQKFTASPCACYIKKTIAGFLRRSFAFWLPIDPYAARAGDTVARRRSRRIPPIAPKAAAPMARIVVGSGTGVRVNVPGAAIMFPPETVAL
jgi:hypothetical protein